MIWHPEPGQRVRLHYGKRYAGTMPCHGLEGVVVAAGRGPGPRNASVRIDDVPWRVIVPRGNLLAVLDVEIKGA